MALFFLLYGDSLVKFRKIVDLVRNSLFSVIKKNQIGL